MNGSIIRFRDVGSTSDYVTIAEKNIRDKQEFLNILANSDFSEGGYQSALTEALCQASDVRNLFHPKKKDVNSFKKTKKNSHFNQMQK